MQGGKSINELAAEVTRQQNAKKDYIADSRSLSLVPVEVQPASPQGESRLDVNLDLGEAGQFGIGEHCHRQLADRLKVPAKYWDRMRAEAPGLLAQNANHWFATDDRRRMVRTLDGRARAYLSDSYRRLDNIDLCEAVLPVVADLGLSIKSCEVTERRLYIQAVNARVQGDVKVGDTVQAGFVISNSEIGAGSFRIEELAYRLICLNGMIVGDVLKKHHAGGKAQVEFEGVSEFFSDTTRRLDDAAFFSKVKETVAHVVSRERFDATLERLQGAAEVRVKPIEAVQVVQNRLGLSDGERDSVLNHLIEGGDLTVWGVSNAVTRMAHDAADYDRSVEFEKAGHDVIELKRSDWQVLEALAA